LYVSNVASELHAALHQQLCIVLTTSPDADVAYRPPLQTVGVQVMTHNVGGMTEQLNRLLMVGN